MSEKKFSLALLKGMLKGTLLWTPSTWNTEQICTFTLWISIWIQSLFLGAQDSWYWESGKTTFTLSGFDIEATQISMKNVNVVVEENYFIFLYCKKVTISQIAVSTLFRVITAFIIGVSAPACGPGTVWPGARTSGLTCQTASCCSAPLDPYQRSQSGDQSSRGNDAEEQPWNSHGRNVREIRVHYSFNERSVH